MEKKINLLWIFTSMPAILLAEENHLNHVASISLLPFFLLIFVILLSMLANSKHRQDQSEISKDTLSIKNAAYNILMDSELSTASIDAEMKFVFCNETFANIFNCGAEALVGKSILDNCPFPRPSEFYKTLERIHQKKEIPEKPIVLGISLHNPKSNESFLDYVALIRPYKEANRDLILIVIVVSQDADLRLDNLLKSIAQKDSDLKKLAEIDQLKSEFLATLSHELKTPLVSIKGYMELMATEKFGPLTDGQKKALRVSLKNTSHLNSLISSILNFARMEAGKLKFDLAPQKISPLISDTVFSMKPIADKSGIGISAEIDQELPWVMIDSELLNRVLINLIDNSIKFSEPGTNILVIAENAEQENMIKVSVIDQGRGIPQDKIEKIKNPFYQADKTDTRPKGGLGLGLAICEKVLTGHGTALKIESEPGKGSNISFLLKSSKTPQHSERTLL